MKDGRYKADKMGERAEPAPPTLTSKIEDIKLFQ